MFIFYRDKVLNCNFVLTMKRVMHILLLLLLSVMIVWTATGFVVMQNANEQQGL